MKSEDIPVEFPEVPHDLKIDGIGRSLRILRDELGMDGADLAAELGVDASTLSKYERGKRAIPFSLFIRLADVTKQSPIALLIWCMRERFPEIGNTSNDISAFLQDALRRLERNLS